MPGRRARLALLAVAALAACAPRNELLNSERIERRFGSYGVEVLEQANGRRRSNLYSLEDGGTVCRTYALVEFAAIRDAELAVAHAEILGGASIGATLRRAGWAIRKTTVYIGQTGTLEEGSEIPGLMRLDAARSLALHVYRLDVRGGGRSIEYAMIAEVHHPEHLDEAGLRELYAVGAERLDDGALAGLRESLRR